MNTDEKLKQASQLKHVMVLNTKIKKDYSNMIAYLKIILRKRARILLIIDKNDVNKLLNSVREHGLDIYKYIERKKLIIAESENLLKNEQLFVDITNESLELGYKKIKAIGFSGKSIDNKIKLLENAYKEGYEYCSYYDVVNIEVDDLIKIDNYYEAIIFEDEDEIEIYKNKKIEELKLILESLQSSVKSKKNTYTNIKKLEQLNALLTSVNKFKSLDEFLKEFLRFLIEVTNASRGGILTKTENSRFEMIYSIGEYTKDSEEEKHLKSLGKTLIKEIVLKDHIIVILNINEFTVVYLAFDKTEEVEQNKWVLEVAVASAKNIVNSLLEKIKNETIIIQNEKLKALGEISNGIAHDFNNILATISGYIALSLAKNQDNNVKEYLDIIKRASLDGAEMLRRIQEFTKDIKEGDKQFFDLNTIIKIAINMINPKLTEKKLLGINININEDLNGIGNIQGREFEIREVIINILNNAIDAMPEGGSINIKSYNEDDKVAVEIEDTGVGIPKNIVSRIFDPFFSTKGVNGNGIGLSVSYKIIKDHNGSIEVDSIEEQGTKFLFKLPIESEYQSNVQPNEENNKLYNHKILVVDDKIWVAMAIGEILKSTVEHVDICYSGSEALEKLENNTYDLVISDLAMPNLNGIELAKQVKKKYPNIKFIIMTGWLGDIEEYNSDIVDCILEKPFGIEEIKAVIERY